MPTKQKWSLNPRGAAWAHDENNSGKKMMEKMGWSKGKGLGREEQGMKDHLTVRLKADTKGMGYKGKDDEWIKHYEGFENALACLNSEENSTANSTNNSTCTSTANSDGEDTEVQSNTTKSLEAVSKTSKKRVHYHKFTRGKDLSRYNADDIGCVLGSKRAKILAKAEIKEEDEEEVGDTEHSHGVVTVNGGNIKEYFAQKMEALKKKSKNESHVLSEDRSYNDDIEDESAARAGFGLGMNVHDGGDGDRAPPYETHNLHTESDDANPDNDAEYDTSRKKKKKKRKHKECIEDVADSKDISGLVPEEIDSEPRKKKKKRSKKDSVEESVCSEELLDEAQEVDKPKKKKKNTEVKITNDDSASVRKKCKKRKEKGHDRKEINEDVDEIHHVKSKKSKKKKHNKVID